jgi:hypothetical protein
MFQPPSQAILYLWARNGGHVKVKVKTACFVPLMWLITIVIGMLLRHFAFDRGTAGAFIVVATIFNAFTLVGWRFVAEQIADRRRS